MACTRRAIIYADFDSATRNDGIVRCEINIVDYSKVTPEVELMLFVFSLMHCVRCLEVDVFQIELVHSVLDLVAGGFC